MTTYTFLILLLAIVGFGITWHIRRMRSKKAPMTCPVGGKCDRVLESKYNSIFGVSNDLAGLFYYAGVFGIAFLLLLGTTTLIGVPLGVGLFLMGASGLVFSVILTGIQAFALKAWCSWCLASALINLVLFILEWKAFL